jgi:hypothetical protein
MTVRMPGAGRLLGAVVAPLLVLSLAACGTINDFTASVLPGEDDVTATNFDSYDAVESAYGNVVAGQTQAQELATIGFDAARSPNVEKLSYLGVMDRFMPGDSSKFDKLAPPVQACIEAQEHCSAVVFRPAKIHAQRVGSLFLDILGFERVTIDTGWSAEVIFLMHDNRVVYKVLQGKPRIREVHDRVAPLGPLQDLGGTALGMGTHAFKI